MPVVGAYPLRVVPTGYICFCMCTHSLLFTPAGTGTEQETVFVEVPRVLQPSASTLDKGKGPLQ